MRNLEVFDDIGRVFDKIGWLDVGGGAKGDEDLLAGRGGGRVWGFRLKKDVERMKGCK